MPWLGEFVTSRNFLRWFVDTPIIENVVLARLSPVEDKSTDIMSGETDALVPASW
jgi:hypothetical protein